MIENLKRLRHFCFVKEKPQSKSSDVIVASRETWGRHTIESANIFSHTVKKNKEQLAPSSGHLLKLVVHWSILPRWANRERFLSAFSSYCNNKWWITTMDKILASFQFSSHHRLGAGWHSITSGYLFGLCDERADDMVERDLNHTWSSVDQRKSIVSTGLSSYTRTRLRRVKHPVSTQTHSSHPLDWNRKGGEKNLLYHQNHNVPHTAYKTSWEIVSRWQRRRWTTRTLYKLRADYTKWAPKQPRVGVKLRPDDKVYQWNERPRVYEASSTL